MKCHWCGEVVLDGEAYDPEAYGMAGAAHHRECWVRRMVGSVAQVLGLPIGRSAGGWPAPGDPPGYSRAEAASASAKLAADITSAPASRRGAVIAEAREIVRLLGPDVIFAWTPGVAAN